MKVELIIDGEKTLEKEIEHAKPDDITQTLKMQLDYLELHKGNKIKMLKGLKGL